MAVRVRAGLVIPDGELGVKFSPSGGPGGQHANRSSTRVELTWRIDESTVLTEADRKRLLSVLGPVVRVVVDAERSQLRNRELAEARLAERVSSALVRPKRRRATGPSRSSVRRRLDAKRRRSAVKEQRRRPGADD